MAIRNQQIADQMAKRDHWNEQYDSANFHAKKKIRQEWMLSFAYMPLDGPVFRSAATKKFGISKNAAQRDWEDFCRCMTNFNPNLLAIKSRLHEALTREWLRAFHPGATATIAEKLAIFRELTRFLKLDSVEPLTGPQHDSLIDAWPASFDDPENMLSLSEIMTELRDKNTAEKRRVALLAMIDAGHYTN